jgi:GNAT superfamily N-acetyltransferase
MILILNVSYTGGGMQVRKAGLEDEATIVALMKKLLIPSGEVEKDWSDRARIVRRIIQNPDLGAVLVAEEDGEIAGVTTLSFPVAIRCDGVYACVEENIVDERFRGKGVGGELLRAAIAEATSRGCAEIQVNARRAKWGIRSTCATGLSTPARSTSRQSCRKALCSP